MRKECSNICNTQLSSLQVITHTVAAPTGRFGCAHSRIRHIMSCYGAFTPEQDNDKTTTRQKLNLCISIMPFTPGLSDLV